MNKAPVFLVAGGDLRQIYLAKSLAGDFKVYITGFGGRFDFGKAVSCDSLSLLPHRADFLILPIPASEDGVSVPSPYSPAAVTLDGLAAAVAAGGTVFGGRMSGKVKSFFSERSLSAEDYFLREEMSVMNAVPTAEGAIQIIMEELPTTVFGSKILITGMGRIAKALIRPLLALGAEVTVAARRRSDMAWGRVFGCSSLYLPEMDGALSEYDVVINTVPAMIFEKERLLRLRKDALAVDLASKPGGFDFDAAGELGVKVIWALSLPGRVAPVTAGRIAADTIRSMLAERGIVNGA